MRRRGPSGRQLRACLDLSVGLLVAMVEAGSSEYRLLALARAPGWAWEGTQAMGMGMGMGSERLCSRGCGRRLV